MQWEGAAAERRGSGGWEREMGGGCMQWEGAAEGERGAGGGREGGRERERDRRGERQTVGDSKTETDIDRDKHT